MICVERGGDPGKRDAAFCFAIVIRGIADLHAGSTTALLDGQKRIVGVVGRPIGRAQRIVELGVVAGGDPTGSREERHDAVFALRALGRCKGVPDWTSCCLMVPTGR